ncbi:MAG: hypothetical protein HF982_09690 [Desulfobacteraceae bacterium]|nr:hypothetical protein [Desulfobacteraceae bacterium]MBC2719838.1 hypothetical protein [Desulfobacteraceae bacterium]
MHLLKVQVMKILLKEAKKFNPDIIALTAVTPSIIKTVKLASMTAIPAQNEHKLLKIKKMLSKSLRKPLSKKDNLLILLVEIKIQLFSLNQRVKISFVNSPKQIVMISKCYVSFEREFPSEKRLEFHEVHRLRNVDELTSITKVDGIAYLF